VTAPAPDLRALRARLAAPDASPCGEAALARLRRALQGACVVPEGAGHRLIRDGRTLGRVRPHGTVTLELDGRPLLGLAPDGDPVLLARRHADGRLQELRVRAPGGSWLAVLPGGAVHPVWGTADRLAVCPPAGPPRPVTTCGATDWDRPRAVPPVADPARLPPGTGAVLLNALAELAEGAGTGPLRYRGPFPTEQLFWSLAGSFRPDAAVPDPRDRFLDGAEATFLAARMAEAPLDWTPAPHEARRPAPDLLVRLRDGVETVVWQGRGYHRPDWHPGRPDLRRPEHRVVRARAVPGGGRRFSVGLDALGGPLDVQLVLDERGEVVERPAEAYGPAAAAGPDVPLAPPWREALAVLLPLDATPLLAPALEAVWPETAVAWGEVPRDLVAVDGAAIRVSHRLARAWREAPETRGPGGEAARALARRLVTDVLGLVAPPVRRRAAAWLADQPPARRAALLDAARRRDRPRQAAEAALRLGRLLDALAAGEAMPA
jgi:hypothetical protein